MKPQCGIFLCWASISSERIVSVPKSHPGQEIRHVVFHQLCDLQGKYLFYLHTPLRAFIVTPRELLWTMARKCTGCFYYVG